MATMTEIPEMVKIKSPYHDYHAAAHVLSGDIKRPIEQKIEEHAPVSLQDRRGGHFTRFTETVSIEGLVTFQKGKTRVSGSRSVKHKGWVTLSTSVMEGLNAFEVITADRVVSQVSTDHPFVDGHIPRVTFLGTQFTNLRVSGFPIELRLNFGICGDKPADGRSYLKDPGFLQRVRKQTERIAEADKAPEDLKGVMKKRLNAVDALLEFCKNKDNQDKSIPGEPEVVCSLVESIGEIPIPGVTSYGNVLVVPEFGWVSFGDVAVGQKQYEDPDEPGTYLEPGVYFKLTSVNMEMGCVGDGQVTAAVALANGRTKP